MTLETLALFGFLIIFVGILVKSADFIEDSFVVFAKRMRISEFLFGFVFLGIVSTLPEISVAINSSRSIPVLSVGNLLGASLILLTLIIGLSAIKFKNVHFKGHFGQPEILISLFCILVSVLLLVDRKFTPIDGLILILLYGVYIFHLFRKFERKTDVLYEEIVLTGNKAFLMLMKAVVGMLFLMISANMIVDIVVEIGKNINISEALIGIFVLSIGTNMPELAILLRAKGFEHEKLALGNFFGSATVNSAVLGLLGILSGGFSIDGFISLAPVLAILVITIIAMGIFSITDRRLSTTEGILLVSFYVSFIISEGIVLVLF